MDKQLLNDYAEAEKIRENAYVELTSYIGKVLENAIDRNVSEVNDVNDTYATIVLKADHFRVISLHYGRTIGERELEMNYSTSGSFSNADKERVQYCKLIGHVANILGDLEDKIIKSSIGQRLFNDFHAAENKCYKIKHQIEAMKAEDEAKAREQMANDILSKINIGTKIMIMKLKKWMPDGQVKTVERITAKNIIFKDDIKRTKKNELVDNIISKKWTIV